MIGLFSIYRLTKQVFIKGMCHEASETDKIDDDENRLRTELSSLFIQKLRQTIIRHQKIV